MDRATLRERLDPAILRERVSERYLAGLALVFAFALWIRLIPRSAMDYLQALDPYMIARMSEAIVTEGHLPLVDAWRYFPFLTPVWRLNLGDIYVPAYMYKLVAPLGIDFVSWTQIYPAFAGALMVAALYFIGKELWGRDAGLLAAFFLAASPAVLHRSSAGWFEKEPFAAFLMFVSIYFVVRAWKRESWYSGMLAGAAFGVAFTVWGGVRFLTLFYPVVAFPVAFLDEDIEKLMAAFTPTIIIGHVLAATLNPARWSVPNATFIFGLGVLSLIWIRYAAETYELVPDTSLRYVVPGLTALGGLLAFLSPLYSQTLAGYVQSTLQKALQESSAVVASTVAENQPATASQIVGSLGAVNAQSIFAFAGTGITEFFSGWTFALIGTAALMLVLSGMLAKKYLGLETVPSRAVYAAYATTFVVLIGLLWFLIPGSAATAYLFAFVLVVTAVAMLAYGPPEGSREVAMRWEFVLPLVWVLSTLFGASQKSRLLFLAAHPVALMAGYGLAVGIREVRRSELWTIATERIEGVEPHIVFKAAVVLFLVPVLVFNGAAAFGMAQSIGGSPNPLWMENLEFMREETPVDSVVLSWWDYGYHFETIGGRAAIADGGNLQFYSNAEGIDYKIINWPLADFLMAENVSEHMDFLRGLSVDYVVLDASMIGKYSAVSTIHNRGESVTGLQTYDCQARNNRCATTTASNNRTYLIYGGSGGRFLVPVASAGNGVRIAGTPLIQQGERTSPVANVCTEQGVVRAAGEGEASLPGCVAFHPYRGYRTLVYIPQDAMRSTLTRLYIMDAAGMDRFTEVFDNGYVKMWKVDAGAAG